MSSDLAKSISAIVDRLISLTAEDVELRTEFRNLAKVLLDAMDIPEPTSSAPDEPMIASDEDAEKTGSNNSRDECAEATPLAAFHHEVDSAEPPVVLPELTLGQHLPPLKPMTGSTLESHVPSTDIDFLLTEVRCRLKADAARWAATRRRLIADHASFSTDIAPMDQEIIRQARTIPDCFLWMCTPSGPSPSNLDLYEEVAASFEALADTVALIKTIQDDSELHQNEFEQSLDLLAESQSALRVAINNIDGPADTDQVCVFNWLKATASENQIFIQRYMRIDDPADPSQCPELSNRIEVIDLRMQTTIKRAKERRKLMGKVRHKLSLINSSSADCNLENWRLLASKVDELVSGGLPPSNRELRELLLPAIDNLPDLTDEPLGFTLVLREIDRFLAHYPSPNPMPAENSVPVVEEVARLMRGRSIVVIGGDRRQGSAQALKEAFNLKELDWIQTREHQSIEGFASHVARSDVAVVMLAIRWSSHSFGEVLKFCNRHGKPLVRLPGGYSPNQVAAQILSQCSDRL